MTKSDCSLIALWLLYDCPDRPECSESSWSHPEVCLKIWARNKKNEHFVPNGHTEWLLGLLVGAKKCLVNKYNICPSSWFRIALRRADTARSWRPLRYSSPWFRDLASWELCKSSPCFRAAMLPRTPPISGQFLQLHSPQSGHTLHT